MPRTQLEKPKSERRQLRRGLTKTYNEISDIFAKSAQTEEEISILKSTAEALHEQFRDCQILDRIARHRTRRDSERRGVGCIFR